MTSIATFSEESVLSRPFGCWWLITMTKSKGSWGETVRGGGQEEGWDPNMHYCGYPPSLVKEIPDLSAWFTDRPEYSFTSPPLAKRR